MGRAAFLGVALSCWLQDFRVALAGAGRQGQQECALLLEAVGLPKHAAVPGASWGEEADPAKLRLAQSSSVPSWGACWYWRGEAVSLDAGQRAVGAKACA